ncbi:Uncharacterised protein [Bordetella pertussis]|nr:Uncharacterised protein [Bordetella pertussis]CPK47948.1 Uncharacterised protein [Bordetella pertussis]CRE28371.1 Uncharacterised protein [Bordetella pertussis]
MAVLRSGMALRALGVGSSAWRPSRRAIQDCATGQRSQAGLPRVHSVAPRSINPCV